jgi:putative aldouronate transport system permease protein
MEERGPQTSALTAETVQEMNGNNKKMSFMILLIMNMGSILNVGFDKVFLMQNTLNKGVSEVISTYVYHLMAPTAGAPQFSLATAVGLFTNVVNFAFLMVTNWFSKKTTGSGLL